MKIVQMVTNLNLHDAIGNDVLAMDEALKQQGFDSHIMAFTIHEALKDRAGEMNLAGLDPEDFVIFHKATGDVLTKAVAGLPCRKVMVYHNITPAKFFLPYDRMMSFNLALGRRQLHRFACRMDACWADSSYNARELQHYGVPAGRIAVLPILFSEQESRVSPDPETERILKTGKGTKLLCIGRVAPNKKLEDAIKVYVRYLERHDPDAVLYLLGSWDGLEKYYAKLKGFCADLGLTDKQVIFTGSVPEEVKEAYLCCTDALLCMSEHEGFCVPLLEAMKRDLPILAYAAAAVPETLGDSALLFGKKDYNTMADALARLRGEENFRAGILEAQRESLKRFDRDRTREEFLRLVTPYTK